MIKRPERYFFVTGSFIFNDMIRSLAIVYFGSTFMANAACSKKQQLLLLCKKYSRKNYIVLKGI